MANDARTHGLVTLREKEAELKMITRFDRQRGFYQTSMLGQVEDSSFAGLYAVCHDDGALKGKTRTHPSFFCVYPRSNHVCDLPSIPMLQRQGVAVDAAMRITTQRSGANTVNPR